MRQKQESGFSVDVMNSLPFEPSNLQWQFNGWNKERNKGLYTFCPCSCGLFFYSERREINTWGQWMVTTQTLDEDQIHVNGFQPAAGDSTTFKGWLKVQFKHFKEALASGNNSFQCCWLSYADSQCCVNRWSMLKLHNQDFDNLSASCRDSRRLYGDW